MKKFSILLIILIIAGLAGCKKSANIAPQDAKWDRDVCARCVMQVSDNLHSAQIINPEDGKHYFFDDFGCALLWLIESNHPWNDKAIIYITDGADGKWIKSSDAVFAKPYNTPMSFGVAAFADKSKIASDKTILTYDEAETIFKEIKHERQMKKAAQNPDMNKKEEHTK